MDEDRRLQAHVNARIIAKIPTHAVESIVAIVVAKPPSLHVLGTGNLFELAGESFVVTAGHVIRTASAYDRTIGISDDARTFIATAGEWLVSSQGDEPDEVLDLAVYRLPPTAVGRLQRKRFLRRADVNVRELPPRAVFTLCGFPGALSEPSRQAGEPLHLRPFEYTTYASGSKGNPLLGFDPRYHLLLDATANQATLSDGSGAVFRNTTGASVPFPRGLGGISGCAVWVIGDLALAVEAWEPAQVVGVQTCVYHDSQLIRATRWGALTTLLGKADPSLQRALDLWTRSDGAAT